MGPNQSSGPGGSMEGPSLRKKPKGQHRTSAGSSGRKKSSDSTSSRPNISRPYSNDYGSESLDGAERFEANQASAALQIQREEAGGNETRTIARVNLDHPERPERPPGLAISDLRGPGSLVRTGHKPDPSGRTDSTEVPRLVEIQRAASIERVGQDFNRRAEDRDKTIQRTQSPPQGPLPHRQPVLPIGRSWTDPLVRPGSRFSSSESSETSQHQRTADSQGPPVTTSGGRPFAVTVPRERISNRVPNNKGWGSRAPRYPDRLSATLESSSEDRRQSGVSGQSESTSSEEQNQGRRLERSIAPAAAPLVERPTRAWTNPESRSHERAGRASADPRVGTIRSSLAVRPSQSTAVAEPSRRPGPDFRTTTGYAADTEAHNRSRDQQSRAYWAAEAARYISDGRQESEDPNYYQGAI